MAQAMDFPPIKEGRVILSVFTLYRYPHPAVRSAFEQLRKQRRGKVHKIKA
jgi:hypothetical protein